jgi:hypothetical protein
MKSLWAAVGVWLLVTNTGFLPPVAAEVVIDGFAAASTTNYVPGVNVLQSTIGATTVPPDTGLAEVLGGIRNMTVEMTGQTDVGLDVVAAGVAPAYRLAVYDSSAGADGLVTFSYDAGGVGLHANLSSAQGLSVSMSDADLAAVPYDVTVTLIDGSLNSVSSTQTITSAGGPRAVRFPFADFPGVNISDLASIAVTIDPSIAGDLRLGRIQTFGLRVPAPLLSPSALVAALAVLLLLARRGISRRA